MGLKTAAPRAVVFDIGGVLVRTEDWSGRRRWERRLGLPIRGLNALVFDCGPAILASTGRGPDEAIWRYVGRKYGLRPDEQAQLREDFWSGDGPNGVLVEFLSRLRPRHKTGILSNAWPEMRDLNVNRFGLGNVVDVTVYSFEVGVLKPAPRSYRCVLEKLGVRAREAVFVDDTVRNIEGAREVGMRTVLFQDTDQTIADLTVLLGA